ncbi:MAG: hypothetical protein ACON31_09695 [Candidatus Puniceispirillaceae bacterium]
MYYADNDRRSYRFEPQEYVQKAGEIWEVGFWERVEIETRLLVERMTNMDVLRDLVEVWPIVVFVGVAVWWAASISRDVKSLEGDMLGLKSDVSDLKTDVTALKTDMSLVKSDVAGLKSDVAEIKAAVLK